MKRVAILGSTGSIGRQTLDIIRNYPDKFSVYALSCHHSIDLLKKQIDEFHPKTICISAEYTQSIRKDYPNLSVLEGDEGMCAIASANEVDVLVVATSGNCAILPVQNAILCDKTIALANKETMVTGGRFFKKLLQQHPASTIIPVDSEHSALWQALRVGKGVEVERVLLTASGGALRDTPIEELGSVSPDSALLHPNWKMGAKITVDCATMMNKGLELIEAMNLFDLPFEKVGAILHRESIVHAIVEYVDGTSCAVMSMPDMRLPISIALFYPERAPLTVIPRLDLAKTEKLSFGSIDTSRYPCFAIAQRVGQSGDDGAVVVMNAANEVAVNAYLSNKITFGEISYYVETALRQFVGAVAHSPESVIELDERVSNYVSTLIGDNNDIN